MLLERMKKGGVCGGARIIVHVWKYELFLVENACLCHHLGLLMLIHFMCSRLNCVNGACGVTRVAVAWCVISGSWA
jgi:hypothetical protein